MLQRVLRLHIFQLFPGITAEGAAGRGEQDARHLVFPFTVKTLENGGMLRIHGKELYAFLLCQRDNDMSRTDQRFLVGKRDVLSRFNGLNGRPDADHADHCAQRDIRLFHTGSFNQSLHAGHHTNVRIGKTSLQLRCLFFVINTDKPGMKFPRLLFQKIDVFQCRKTGYLQVAVFADHFQRLGTDGTGRAQNRNTLHKISSFT